VKAKVVLEDVGLRENGVKRKLLENIPLHTQEQKCGTNIYELEDHVGEEGLSSNLMLKLGFAKKNPFASFLSYLLKNI
jgi:hypothetical protein